MTTISKHTMLPYQREDRDIYVGLEFHPNDLMELWSDNMFLEPALLEINYLLKDRLAGCAGRTDVLVSGASLILSAICYGRSNRNICMTLV